MRTIVVATQKGGSGKSTIVAHLGVAAAENGQRVALIDTDPQGSLAGWGARREADTPIVAAASLLRLAEAIEAARAAEMTLCVVDTPGSFGAAEANAIALADFILVPARPSPFDLGAIAKTLDVVRATGKPAAIVLTQCRPVGSEAAEMRAALAGCEVEVLVETIGVRVAFVTAITGGLAVTEFERSDSAAVVEIRSLYRALKGRLYGKQQTEADPQLV
jgi:chromosome partitioning protein